jgi:hypothetical protein
LPSIYKALGSIPSTGKKKKRKKEKDLKSIGRWEFWRGWW